MSEQVRQMFGSIAEKYDLINTVLSFGIHHRWRKKAVKLSGAKPGHHVLDCATGTGDFAITFKKKVGPQGHVIGTDFSDAMIAPAPGKARKKGLDIQFEVADAMDLPFEEDRFDIASIAFGIRNVDDPVVCLREMARVVKPGGKVIVLEFGQAYGIMKVPFTLYSKYVMPTVGGWLSGNKHAYEYLPETSAKFPAGEKFLALMQESGGYSTQSYHTLQSGVAYIYVGTVAG
ncbi:MAG: bifunctional demethylmenaquinone methyltransferase/2-methoxy-6-polyprenyl-1,4-benzoquinol methylase UbiE [Candidatus Cyclonatronum sp.]|uniref:bifunctional demethylmenaquinone methyltransferase/2-methoxy-6-polyprenyl-1,4-benzoquinol methylase UbiE n=1 Tax=Cyclonatronum sp. TaxID=3024185 RepID=UPI0025C704F7|nr:bifunctional demethylmenaquinone methyltransferase/2-methoxy-6-polyprenyl-1,4-benzoquinol methylase UbiE [Cyclonatronum sp.]MCH8485926.1 bifunctional demethylmenaquinone methyltransferase/2-methoxy-6-polyprenyl-1,4-benzoquinol methylase UbiE [Cyclonatronum sp.]